MKPLSFVFLTLALNITLWSHPGSGIVVDRQGNVYFVDTGSGVWKIDLSGKLTRIPGPAYHWMAIDVDNSLAKVSLPFFATGDATVTRAFSTPTLLLSSDFPLSVARDGSLYYPWFHEGNQLKVFRLSPSGGTTLAKTLPSSSRGEPLQFLNGIASGPDGSLYYTEDGTVRKLSRTGEVSIVVENVTLPICEGLPGLEPHQTPYFRGLDVDSMGTVYVAASGCRSVVKVTPGKELSVVLRESSPWSPTGIAVFGGNVYVLEYTHDEGDDRRAWIPRVKRIFPDGRIVTIATIQRQ